ncbi:hypothetical protein ACSRUE_24565 [Sorangium sp. KYC3313]|uniref:hypothetical protein n=1 Tax=Sorangium sp. KYC3313 TaxID=3449740 RepID=UPI003F8C1C7F
MFRSDRDALAGKLDDVQAENERLRRQNEAMRHALLAQRVGGQPVASNTYRGGVAGLGAGERVALARHQLEAFPVWATALLHVVTFGIVSFIRFNAMHAQLPQAERDDPSVGKAIGLHFAPYFNYYWIFWNGLRLCDRVNLQCRLRGMPDGVPRGLVIAACVASVIPYIQLLTGPITWLFVAIAMQRTVNRIVELDARPTRERVAPVDAGAGVFGVRFPAVQALPLPDDAAVQAEAEAEAAAAVAEQRRRR